MRRGDAVYHPQPIPQNRDPSPREPILAAHPAGRSSGFRINLRPRLPIQRRTVTFSGVCPRLQRRDRDGIAPSSLIAHPGDPQGSGSYLSQPEMGVKGNVIRFFDGSSFRFIRFKRTCLKRLSSRYPHTSVITKLSIFIIIMQTGGHYYIDTQNPLSYDFNRRSKFFESSGKRSGCVRDAVSAKNIITKAIQ